MAMQIMRPPKEDVTAHLRRLYIQAEQRIISEILRKRAQGYVDYAEVAALERIRRILQELSDETWTYAPKLIEKIFYRTAGAASGYENAAALSVPQAAAAEQLANNLIGTLTEATETAYQTAAEYLTIGRLEADPYRTAALTQVSLQEATGGGWRPTAAQMETELRGKGLTCFTDKAGRRWSLSNYSNMCVRTTARQAEVAALLTADDYDLWQITKVGSTCPVCAPLEGRVYSKSGTNPDYPPLSLAFGKIDPAGGDDLSNTYLNIHPNCLHAIVKYTTIGKSEKQIRRDKDFSNPQKNPLNRDPRTKKQIEAYREKEKNRRQLIEDKRQFAEYRAALGTDAPKDFAKFREIKYNEPEKWRMLQKTKRTYAEIDRKDWTDEFKVKSKQKFTWFKNRGVIMSSHALGRLSRLNKDGLLNITENELLKLIRGKPNYIESGTKWIYFDSEKQLMVVRNMETGDIVSVVRRKNPKGEWKHV